MLKLDELANQTTIIYSDSALCEMKCENIKEDEVKESFTYGKINSKQSEDVNRRYPVFNFTGQTHGGRTINVICVQRDSITRILMAKDLKLKMQCNCK